MHLAQEIVDYIVDFLHDDQTALTQASLVSRAWASRTRVHLCETMNITSCKLRSSNLSYLTPLCSYVKTLRFTGPGEITDLSALLDCFEQSELHTLVIDSWELDNLGRQSIRRWFVKFPRLSVTTLELLSVYPGSATPLTLLSLFPNVDNFAISACLWWKISLSCLGNGDDEVTQATSLPRFRGSFRFFDSPANPRCYQRSTLHAIAASPLQFQIVSLDIRSTSWEDSLSLLNSCSKTAREVSVEFISPNPRTLDPPSTNRPPINFTSLEELWITIRDTDDLVPRDGYSVHSLLKLVISPCLQRVVVRTRDTSVPETVGWAPLDESLADLVKRCQAYGNLTPLIMVVGAHPQHIRGLFPRVSRLGLLQVF